MTQSSANTLSIVAICRSHTSSVDGWKRRSSAETWVRKAWRMVSYWSAVTSRVIGALESADRRGSPGLDR